MEIRAHNHLHPMTHQEYATGSHGGSVYFDGTGDYLDVTSSALISELETLQWRDGPIGLLICQVYYFMIGKIMMETVFTQLFMTNTRTMSYFTIIMLL